MNPWQKCAPLTTNVTSILSKFANYKPVSVDSDVQKDPNTQVSVDTVVHLYATIYKSQCRDGPINKDKLWIIM